MLVVSKKSLVISGLVACIAGVAGLTVATVGANARATPVAVTPDSKATPSPSASIPASVKATASPQAPQLLGAEAKTGPKTSQNQTAHGAKSTYQVNEQFSGAGLNDSLWQAMTYPAGYRNHEEQDYSPSQVRVANGFLQITASRDSSGQWHSGEVHSKWNYTYGEFEVRLAISATGSGVWPASWLLGTTDPWPYGGELDMMENINGQSTVYGTIHGGGSNGPWQLQHSYSGIDVTKFHTYKLVKQPGYISWWIDGIKQGEWYSSQTPPGGIWPFETHSNFAILNLAIGGDWPGPSTSATPNNITLNVDYYTVKNAY